MSGPDEELQDVSTSEAYKVLTALVDAGEVPTEKAAEAKDRFAKLHAALVASMTQEKQLLDEAKALKRRLEDGAAASTSASTAATSGSSSVKEATLEALRDDVEAALSESAMAGARQQMLQLEAADLQRQRNELGLKMDELAVEHAAALYPLIVRARVEVEELTVEAEAEAARAAAAVRECEEGRTRLQQLQVDMVRLAEEKVHARQTLAKVDVMPEKARRQAEAVQTMLRSVAGQLDSATARYNEYDGQCKSHQEKEREQQEEHARITNQLERGRVQVEAKERHADDIRKDVELAGIEADKILADAVDLDMKLKSMDAEVKSERDTLARRQREKELLLRQYKNTSTSLKELQELLPNMKYQTEQLQRDRTAVEAKLRHQHTEMQELKRDLDIHMSDFLQEECMGKDMVALFQLTFREVQVLEAELAGLKHEEAERHKTLMELGSQRDRVALGIAQKLAKVKEVQQAEAIKEVEQAELRKSYRQAHRRIRDFEKLYDLVKNQRNKFVNLIQTASQAITEMRDKLKILGNELDILHHEVHSKDRLLGQSRAQHSSSVSERDTLRVEMGKLRAAFRERQALVDEQINEVDTLNAIISSAEKALLRLKKQYEVVIEARNYTGIMLIDRNDELCILYEKHNIQDEVLKGGQLELQRRDDEQRLLKIDVADLQRSIEVTRKIIPQIPALDTDVARLQNALLEARREGERLAISLEDPGNSSRWRLLEGKIPDREELSAKIQQLEERLNDKKEQLLEKELILEEISSLSDKLRSQASEGRADTLELSKRVNEYQSKLRAVTRKMTATISELSMYQAASLKLAGESTERDQDLLAARGRLDAGFAPTEEAEREWARLERERYIVEDLAATRAEVSHMQDSHLPEMQSTAETRPNAYIPEALGIPKPYGGFAPFKPTDTGSTMRHIRKPQPKEIII